MSLFTNPNFFSVSLPLSSCTVLVREIPQHSLASVCVVCLVMVTAEIGTMAVAGKSHKLALVSNVNYQGEVLDSAVLSVATTVTTRQCGLQLSEKYCLS